jgi:hypothetical protein
MENVFTLHVNLFGTAEKSRHCSLLLLLPLKGLEAGKKAIAAAVVAFPNSRSMSVIPKYMSTS